MAEDVLISGAGAAEARPAPRLPPRPRRIRTRLRAACGVPRPGALVQNARMSDSSSPPTSAERAALRRSLRDRRKALSAPERIVAAERVAERLLALPFAPQQGYVAGYWAMDGEVALHVWQLRLPRGVVYCLPVLHDDGRMRFAPWRPGDPLAANRYGIPEPQSGPGALLAAGDMTLVVTPLVGFDRSGRRLGMGAGWYDRTFADRLDAAPPPWLVGAAHAAQEVEALPEAPWDVPMDAICTESETLMPAAA